jgi:hypothetical protein
MYGLVLLQTDLLHVSCLYPTHRAGIKEFTELKARAEALQQLVDVQVGGEGRAEAETTRLCMPLVYTGQEDKGQ